MRIIKTCCNTLGNRYSKSKLQKAAQHCALQCTRRTRRTNEACAVLLAPALMLLDQEPDQPVSSSSNHRLMAHDLRSTAVLAVAVPVQFILTSVTKLP